MNWDAIGAVGEIIGAIAVFVTLLYLAAQIKFARKATSAQLEENVNSSWNRDIRAWGENEDVANLMAEGLDHYDELSQGKKLMFHVRMDALMVEHLKQQQLADQDVWGGPTLKSHEQAILRMLLCPGGRAWWDETSEVYPSQDYWNELLQTQTGDLQPLNVYSWLSSK